VGRLGEVLEQIGSEKPLVLADSIVGEVMGGSLEGISGAPASGSGASAPRRR